MFVILIYLRTNIFLRGLLTTFVVVGMVSCTRSIPPPETAQSTTIQLTQQEQAQVEDLDALGYLGGSEDVTQLSGVVIHNRSKAQPGYNFYVANNEASASLLDMDGNVLHQWTHKLAELTSEGRKPDKKSALEAASWRRAYVYPNGDLLAIHNGFGMIKLDKDSKLLWEFEGLAHHDLEVLRDGPIYVLTFEDAIIPRINSTEESRDDFISVLDPDGNLVRKVSLLKSIERSGYKQLMANLPTHGDLLHTNTLEVLDGSLANRIPEFKKGNVLVSFLTLSTVAVIDMDARKVVWTLNGDFQFQHDPTVLDNGHLLVFDNLGLRTAAVRLAPQARDNMRNLWYKLIFSKNEDQAHSSRVFEIDPLTQQTVWQYPAAGQRPFFSATCGSAYRLPNGNTLITESQFGRSFELSSEGEIVWEFYGPQMALAPKRKATLFDVQRLPADFPVGWVNWPPQSD